MWKRFKELWGATRHLLAVRSLLDVLGWKDAVVTILSTVAMAVWTYYRGLSGPLQVVLALAVAVLVPLGLLVLRVWRMMPAIPTQAARGPTVGDGPEIVIDYYYAEDSRDHHDANAPLVVKNASTTARAYNVEVLALATPEGVVTFEPPLISRSTPRRRCRRQRLLRL